MRVYVVAGAVLAIGLTISACSNNSYPSVNPGAPSGPMSPSPSPAPSQNPDGTVTINVVAINGAQSFSPNPADVPAGQMVVWHNIDSVTHHVVLNDGSVDTGDLAPGASSAPMAIKVAGGPYHCSIHPVMVGTINQAMPPDAQPDPQPAPQPY